MFNFYCICFFFSSFCEKSPWQVSTTFNGEIYERHKHMVSHLGGYSPHPSLSNVITYFCFGYILFPMDQ